MDFQDQRLKAEIRPLGDIETVRSFPISGRVLELACGTGLWSRLRTWLSPGGFVAFCDDRDGPDRPYSGDTVPGGPGFAHRRRLSGEREYEIVKVFYSSEELENLIGGLGWDAEVRATGQHFLFGTARPKD